MTKKINKKFLFYLLILISAVIISAYIIEYNFGYKPCKLCIYERIPYIVAILLIIKNFFSEAYEKETVLILSIIFALSVILAFYHFGIEQGFFEETLACTAGNFSETLTKDELLEQLKLNTISCKDVNFKILGLSLASINAIFSFCLSAIFLKLFLNYGKN